MKSYFLVIIAVFILVSPVYAKNELNVYSFRKSEMISPLIEAFERDTKIKVNLVYGKPKFLLNKLSTEKELSLADVILTSELSQLNEKLSLLQPITSLANATIEPELIDEKRLWVALSLRIRALFTVKDANVPVLSKYAQLNQSDLQGTFCNRDFKHSYNQQMKSALLAITSGDDTKWLDNPTGLLKKRPSGGDRDQLRALYKNQCNYALSNHYYFYMLQNSSSPFDQEVAAHLDMHFLQTKEGQTPVSATAAAISRYAPNLDNAQKFINYLISMPAQKLVAAQLNEFAVHPKVRKQQLSEIKSTSLALESVKGAL